MLSLLPDPESVEGSFAYHPLPSSCLERLASSPRSVLRTFYTQLISWAMPVSHLAAFLEAQKATLGAKVLGSNCSLKLETLSHSWSEGNVTTEEQ